MSPTSLARCAINAIGRVLPWYRSVKHCVDADRSEACRWRWHSRRPQQAGRPVPKSDILFVLENALRMSSVVLVRDTAGYRLVPLGEAIGAGNIDRDAASAEPGFGISVVPLRHASAATLIKLLDSFAIKPG